MIGRIKVGTTIHHHHHPRVDTISLPLHDGVRSGGSVGEIEFVCGVTLGSGETSASFIGATLSVSEADGAV